MRHVLIDIAVHPALPIMPTSRTLFTGHCSWQTTACETTRTPQHLASPAPWPTLGEDIDEHPAASTSWFAEAAEACGIRWWRCRRDRPPSPLTLLVVTLWAELASGQAARPGCPRCAPWCSTTAPCPAREHDLVVPEPITLRRAAGDGRPEPGAARPARAELASRAADQRTGLRRRCPVSKAIDPGRATWRCFRPIRRSTACSSTPGALEGPPTTALPASATIAAVAACPVLREAREAWLGEVRRLGSGGCVMSAAVSSHQAASHATDAWDSILRRSAADKAARWPRPS